MPVVGNLQKVVRKGGTKIVCRWTVEDFVRSVQKEGNLYSDNIVFGPGIWYAGIKLITGSSVQVAAAEVQLCGPYDIIDAHSKDRVCWKMSVLDMEDKSAEGVRRKGDDEFLCSLPLGALRDLPKGPIKVQFELCIVAEGNTDISTQTETHPGDPEIVGTLDQFTKNSWVIPEFPVLAQRGRCLSSRSFEFRTMLWQLHISSKISEVSLSLKSAIGSRVPFPFSWELSAENDWGDVLKRNDGFQDTEETLDVALSLGPLTDVQRFVESDGALRVQCELRLLDDITDPASRVETEAVTDILVRDFQRLLTSGESSDATVRVKAERDFLVHRSVLVARTPIFASMFRNQMSESVTGVVNVEDCEPDTFEQFLQHVYTGRVENLCPERALKLYQVADKYQVDDLKSKCLECVKGGISVKLFCPTLKLALQHSEPELTQYATEFYAKKLKEIIVTVEWQQFIVENPIAANELLVRALGAASTT